MYDGKLAPNQQKSLHVGMDKKIFTLTIVKGDRSKAKRLIGLMRKQQEQQARSLHPNIDKGRLHSFRCPNDKTVGNWCFALSVAIWNITKSCLIAVSCSASVYSFNSAICLALIS